MKIGEPVSKKLIIYKTNKNGDVRIKPKSENIKSSIRIINYQSSELFLFSR
jgi:hypothetical protein